MLEWSIHVSDVEPPTIQCPDNVEMEATSSGRANVTWPSPTAVDNDRIESVSSNIEVGESLSVGTYLVNYTVFDPSSNMAECSFNITLHRKYKSIIQCCIGYSIEWFEILCNG